MSVGYSDRAGPSSCEHDACQSLPLSSTVAGGSLVRLAHPGDGSGIADVHLDTAPRCGGSMVPASSSQTRTAWVRGSMPTSRRWVTHGSASSPKRTERSSGRWKPRCTPLGFGPLPDDVRPRGRPRRSQLPRSPREVPTTGDSQSPHGSRRGLVEGSRCSCGDPRHADAQPGERAVLRLDRLRTSFNHLRAAAFLRLTIPSIADKVALLQLLWAVDTSEFSPDRLR